MLEGPKLTQIVTRYQRQVFAFRQSPGSRSTSLVDVAEEGTGPEGSEKALAPHLEGRKLLAGTTGRFRLAF